MAPQRWDPSFSGKKMTFYSSKTKISRSGILETDEQIASTDGIFCSNEGYCVEIRDKNGKALPVGEPGEVFVKSPDLMMGYIGYVSFLSNFETTVFSARSRRVVRDGR